MMEANEEQEMLRAGLDPFAFAPRPNERCELMLGKFDDMLERANNVSNLRTNYPFKT